MTAEYAKPASQIDLEARLKNDNKSNRVLSTADSYEGGDAPEKEEGYVGVDPIYQNAANDVDEPIIATEGPESEILEAHGESEGVTTDWRGGSDSDDDEEKDDDASSGQISSSTPPASDQTPGQ